MGLILQFLEVFPFFVHKTEIIFLLSHVQNQNKLVPTNKLKSFLFLTNGNWIFQDENGEWYYEDPSQEGWHQDENGEWVQDPGSTTNAESGTETDQSAKKTDSSVKSNGEVIEANGDLKGDLKTIKEEIKITTSDVEVKSKLPPRPADYDYYWYQDEDGNWRNEYDDYG